MTRAPQSGRVARSSGVEILRDLEARIKALERSPGGSGSIYVDDRILDADTEVVTFSDFPSDAVVLELTWDCELVFGATRAFLFVCFNGDYSGGEDEYHWRLVGDVEASDDDGGNSAGGVALIDDQINTFGRIRLPDYSRDTSVMSNSGPSYVGEGTAGSEGGNTPDAWVAAGESDGDGPVTEIQVFASTDSTSGGVQNLMAGSRLTLTAY